MPQQVTVTLAAVTGNFEPRTLLLTPNDDTVPIGRASKSVVKGILGAVDNAWFDSPVMSRDHAELRLDPATTNVTIHDNGSMHGTTLNDKKLEQMTEVVLNNGDVLVFGAEVRRGPEVFPACSFKVDMKFAPYHSGNTFSAPDSDIEDDEDEIYGSSDNDKDEHERASSGDGVSIDSSLSVGGPVQIACPQPVKVAYSIQAIDLTRDDSPILAATSQMIDLTRDSPIDNNPIELPPSPDSRSMETAPIPSVPSTNMDAPAQQGGFALYAEDHPVLVDSEGEYGEYSSGLDDQSEIVLSEDSDNSDDSASEDSNSNSDDSEEIESVDEEDISESSDDDVDDELEDSFDESQEIDSSKPHFSAYPQSVGGCGQGCGGLVMTQNHAAGSEDVMDSEDNDEGDESDLGLSKAGNEGNVEYPTESEMYYSKEAFEELSDDVPAAKPATNMQFTGESVKEPVANNPTEGVEQGYPLYPWSQAPLVQVVEPKMPSLNPDIDQANADNKKPEQIVTSNLSLGRQPSPSDAAMVKTAPSKPFEVWQKAPELGKLSQTLGEKTGKHAFFEAREKNKAKLSFTEKKLENRPFSLPEEQTLIYKRSSGSVVERTPENLEKLMWGSTSTPLTNMEVPSEKPQTVRFGIEGPESFQSFLQYQYPPGMDACTIPHNSSPLLERATSPDYDMTSAVSFNESKAKSVRSRLSIHDIIEKSSRDQSPPQAETKVGTKRKASEISDSIQDEVRAWASSPDRSPVVHTLDLTTPEPSSTLVERPAKKLKTVMDRVAYAAVGGFAVGATLFFGLVATAPDFV